MAIWDIKEKTTTLSADSRKCLNCGDNLKFFVEEGYLKCVSCGSEFSPEIFEINAVLEEKIEHEIDFNSEKEDEITRFFREKHQEIICNACGSVVLTNKNTISTFCAFCGSPAVIERRIQKEFLPDGIIPFKVSRDDAQQNIRKWLKTQKTAPRGFMSQKMLDKMTGIYVPFWLVDADCEMNVSGSCYRYDHMNQVYYEYFVRRNGSFPMKLVPFDGSKRIPDTLMEAIEPYDYKELVDFNDSYLNGVYAERYDQSPSELAPRIHGRFKDYMYELARKLTDDKYTTHDMNKNYSTASNYKCYYALLPVWFLTYTYNGGEYSIAVNGQTGEVAGRTPDSAWGKFINGVNNHYALIVSSIIVLGMAALTFMLLRPLNIGVAIMLTCYVTTLLAVACLAAYKSLYRYKIRKNPPQNEIDKLKGMPDPFNYIDQSKMKIHLRTDDYIGTVELEGNKKGRNLYRLINSKR